MFNPTLVKDHMEIKTATSELTDRKEGVLWIAQSFEDERILKRIVDAYNDSDDFSIEDSEGNVFSFKFE